MNHVIPPILISSNFIGLRRSLEEAAAVLLHLLQLVDRRPSVLQLLSELILLLLRQIVLSRHDRPELVIPQAELERRRGFVYADGFEFGGDAILYIKGEIDQAGVRWIVSGAIGRDGVRRAVEIPAAALHIDLIDLTDLLYCESNLGASRITLHHVGVAQPLVPHAGNLKSEDG